MSFRVLQHFRSMHAPGAHESSAVRRNVEGNAEHGRTAAGLIEVHIYPLQLQVAVPLRANASMLQGWNSLWRQRGCTASGSLFHLRISFEQGG